MVSYAVFAVPDPLFEGTEPALEVCHFMIRVVVGQRRPGEERNHGCGDEKFC